VRKQADDVAELLADADRCQVVLVTLAETTPVNETIDTARALQDKVGVTLGPVVVNAVDAVVPLDVGAASAAAKKDRGVLVEAARFRRARTEMQLAAIERLTALLPLPQVHVPLLPTGDLTPAAIDALIAGVTVP
jgi:hypothetical protein